MASWVQIANLALRRLGADRIASLTEDSENARAVNDVHETVRDAVLRLHPWNCALTRASLAADAVAPAWGYAASYTLPADPYALRIWRLADSTIEYKVEGRKLLTDAGAPLQVLARITDPELFDASLTVTMAAALAAETAFRLTNSRTAEEAMQRWFEQTLTRARSADAQEGTPESIEADEFERSRL
jgi:hypothetical protein